MSNVSEIDPSVYEWQACSLVLPRFGKLLDRTGVHTRWLSPGKYYVRRSRSLGQSIYRRIHSSAA